MALLHPDCIKAIISIENEMEKTIGTGFLFFKTTDGKTGKLYIVTAKHVLLQPETMNSNPAPKKILLRFNLKEGGTLLSPYQLYNKNNKARFHFLQNKNLDVAIIELNPYFLESAKIDCSFISSLYSLLPDSLLNEKGISIGDEIYFLGFPCGMRGKKKNFPICRKGIIARLDEETLEDNCIFLDAPVFPGNSGGPVFYKPTILRIEGTRYFNKSIFLGVATGYFYREEQDPAEKIKSSESHLGLAKIITSDAIIKTIDDLEKTPS